MPLSEEPLDSTMYDAPPTLFGQDAVPPESRPALSNPTVPGVFGDTPGEDGEREQAPDQREFNPKYREPFLGLLYLGALTATFDWLGHRFIIRTLKVGEFMEIGVVTQPYVGTDSALKASQCATISLCVLSVDGQEIPALPLTQAARDTVLSNRFDYVRRNWYAITIDKVWEEYVLLEIKVRETVDEMVRVAAMG